MENVPKIYTDVFKFEMYGHKSPGTTLRVRDEDPSFVLKMPKAILTIQRNQRSVV